MSKSKCLVYLFFIMCLMLPSCDSSEALQGLACLLSIALVPVFYGIKKVGGRAYKEACNIYLDREDYQFKEDVEDWKANRQDNPGSPDDN